MLLLLDNEDVQGASLDSAEQSSRNSVDVTFDDDLRSFNRADPADALNPNNWSLTPVDPFGAAPRLVQHVEEIDALTFRVYVDGPLSDLSQYEIAIAAGVETELGVPMGSALAASFPTFGYQPARTQTSPVEGLVDIANPFLRSDAPGENSPLGTYDISESGDYRNETGAEYLRKRILRRATTIPGQFTHMPEYGFGEKFKGLISPALLQRMRARAQAQIMQEPDVRSVFVSVKRGDGAPNVVFLYFRAVMRTGEQVSGTVPIELGG